MLKEVIYFTIFFIIRIKLMRNITSELHSDEIWQGPEIAHRLYYGYGFLSWEWTDDKPLRSPVFPLILGSPYLISFNSPFLVRHGPRILMCLFAAIFDLYLVKIGHLL